MGALPIRFSKSPGVVIQRLAIAASGLYSVVFTLSGRCRGYGGAVGIQVPHPADARGLARRKLRFATSSGLSGPLFFLCLSDRRYPRTTGEEKPEGNPCSNNRCRKHRGRGSFRNERPWCRSQIPPLEFEALAHEAEAQVA